MITFLSSPKPFTGVAGTIQLNALQSWLRVHSHAEVILYGDVPGCRDACAALGVEQVTSVACNPSGVPFFGAIVDDARARARHDMQVYLNCDILLTPAIVDAVRAVKLSRFLIIGQRIDLSKGASIVFDDDDWARRVEDLARSEFATLHEPSGIDYFIFPRGLWQGLLPLTIGRAGYDSALLGYCLRRNIPVIDATYAIPALHQYHDYGHVRGAEAEVMSGPDAANNKRLHGVAHSPPNIADATWRLVGGVLVPNNARGDRLRHFENFLRYDRDWILPSYAIRALWRLLTRLGLYRPARIGLSEVRESLFSR